MGGSYCRHRLCHLVCQTFVGGGGFSGRLPLLQTGSNPPRTAILRGASVFVGPLWDPSDHFQQTASSALQPILASGCGASHAVAHLQASRLEVWSAWCFEPQRSHFRRCWEDNFRGQPVQTVFTPSGEASRLGFWGSYPLFKVGMGHCEQFRQAGIWKSRVDAMLGTLQGMLDAHSRRY